MKEFTPFGGKRETWLHLWGINEWPGPLFRPDKCDLLRTGSSFDLELDLSDSNLYCGQMDSDLPCGGLAVIEKVNKQEYKIDLKKN